MPNCRIHLSVLEPKMLNAKSGPEKYHCYQTEEPDQVFQGHITFSLSRFSTRQTPYLYCEGLVAGEEYYVYVQQDSEQERKDQEDSRKVEMFCLLPLVTPFSLQNLLFVFCSHERFANAKIEDEACGERAEGCSCIEGNPCVNEYVCRNWYKRFAIAKQNGWNG
jgi:hypothetical protein